MIRVLRILHRWLGLVLVLPMLVQGITGFVLAVTPMWEALRPVPAIAIGVHQPASAILAAAALPGLVPVRYEPGASATVDLAPPGQRRGSVQVTIDPVSLAVLGERHPSAVYRWIRDLHEMLLLPVMPGRSIVGWFGVGLLLLGLSGIVLWWPARLAPQRWRKAVTISAKAKGARFQRQLHGAAGFWISAMLVVMSLSGVALGFPETVRAMLGVPGRAPMQARPPGGVPEALDIDAVIHEAGIAVPGAAVTNVILPNSSGRPVIVRLERTDAVQGTPPVIVSISPAGRRVIAVQDPSNDSAGSFTVAWLHALHYGEAFGWPWRVLVMASGLVLPLLAVTGATLWMLKRRNRNRIAVQRQAALLEAAE